MKAVASDGFSNLPPEASSFVGRRRELADLKRLLARLRVVTLTGVGGVGKSRLALRVAAQVQVQNNACHGVRLIDLSGLDNPARMAGQVSDPQLVARVVMGALGLREATPYPPLQLLTAYLAPRRVLLVLDNCEHLIAAVATLVDVLVRACPRLRILVTSREPLAIAGERIFEVPPLPVPDQTDAVSLADLARNDAAALFLARGRAVAPDFALTQAHQQAVARICRRLEGIPLAIELAAVRLQALTPEQILAQLADRFTPLGWATAHQHRTLLACIDWSFELCTGPERRLWARLSVFAAGFELDAVEGICADDILPEHGILDLVTALIDKSILMSGHHSGAARYRMLDTIRDYGRDKLRIIGGEAQLRRRHRDWYHQLLGLARDDFIGPRQPYWLDRLGREHANLRTAIEYSLTERGQADVALQMVLTVPWAYWVTRGLFGEARSWLTAALAETTSTAGLHARALLLASCLALWQGEFHTATRQLDQAEKLAWSLGDPAAITLALYVRSLTVAMCDDLLTAMTLLERALIHLRTPPQPDLELQLRILTALAIDAALAGDRAQAELRYQQIVAITEPRGGRYYRFYALWGLAIETFRQGRLDSAAAQVAASLRMKLPVDRYGTALCLEATAWIAAGQHRYERAATLLGAADTIWAEIGTTIAVHPTLIGFHNTCERLTRGALGDPGYATAFQRGRGLSYDNAAAVALEHPPTGYPGVP